MTETSLPIASIQPGRNDRTVFDAEALRLLADNIAENGLAQAITVRPLDGGRYEIVAGERRLRACQLLGWETVPATVRALSDEQASAIMLAENIARADLDPVDEALAYQARLDSFGWTVERLAERAGVSIVHIRFRLRLLTLRAELLRLIRSGQLGLGYAQTLAQAGLDANRQMIAVRALQDNPAPTPGWFRRLVAALAAEQSQDALLDLAAFTVAPAEGDGASAVEPAHPATTRPPRRGRSPSAIIRNQVAFWMEAARQWADLGKPFKRQECEAAAQALEAALAALA